MEDIQHVRDMIRQEPVLASLRRQQLPRSQDRLDRIARFENKAEELRTVAEDLILNDTRLTLLALANSYERMAVTLRGA